MCETALDIQIKTLPDLPGVYQYYDVEGKILYVGKAKNLKKRVSSYFTKNHDYGKTKILVKKIADRGITLFLIEHIMRAIMGVSNRIIALHHGQKIAEGTPEEVSTNKKVIEVYLGE